MIKRKFIEKVHDAFDELNYHENDCLNFDDFMRAVAYTLSHCKDLCDAQNAVNLCRFCLKNGKKIEKIFKKKLSVFNEYYYEGSALISMVSDEESLGTYYITNGIWKKWNQIFVASSSFEDGFFVLNYRHGCFRVFDDGEYYLKSSKMSSVKMKIFDKYKNCLCNVVLSKKYDIFLEKNITPYELVIYDDFIGVYDRRYIESLADADIIDTNRLLADIEWDLIDKKSDLGVAKLNVYAPDQDIEMLLLLASSTFLVYKNYVDAEKRSNYIMAMNNMSAMQMINRR